MRIVEIFRVLLRAEIDCGEKFLQQDDLCPGLGGLADHDFGLIKIGVHIPVD